MTGSVIAANPTLPARGYWPWRIAIVATLIALADWLFFRQVIGVSIALFALAVGASILATNRVEVSRREWLLYTGILVIGLLPLLEDINVMSAAIAALALGTFALGVAGALNGGFMDRLTAVGWYLTTAPFQFFRDLPLLRDWARLRGAPVSFTAAKGWIVPLALGGIFLALFASANPLIEQWLRQWSMAESIRQFDIRRMIFWVGTMIAVWAFVRVSDRFALPERTSSTVGPSAPAEVNPIFNDAAIMRSLVLFNLLFAVQTVLDINYLWRGAALPDGMTYASYAHRGAYPLIVTALLAAAFVIAAMRPGSDAERSPVMRALVYLWVAQNVLLVGSSILRLELYVGVYLLTYWRIAAFVWMLLVAAGLLLIVVRIVTCRSNAWLISANLALLTATIYACSFVNFADLVASYNISHSADSARAGRPLDITYVADLGPQAIPALDRYLAANAQSKFFVWRRQQLAVRHLNATANWRAFTFRNWRLTQYLERAKHTQP